LGVIDALNWGLVVYDEVHLLPAPVFQLTAQLQARRRLGLTATLVREDGREGDVFSLIGPKRFDVPWKQLEAEGYIAPATCIEIRLDLPPMERLEYASSTDKERFRLASTTTAKSALVTELLALHPDDPTLIIGTYVEQIEKLSEHLGVAIITGETPVDERERLYAQFRSGEITRLVVSKVANFSLDLPEASVAIQVSGSFGSRQEEAQRLGRILRPKADGRPATFYTLVARDTVDQDFALNRQRFLAEQGYGYSIMDAAEITQKLPIILSDKAQPAPR
jgi:DNA excision repair protein ERCC-3